MLENTLRLKAAPKMSLLGLITHKRPSCLNQLPRLMSSLPNYDNISLDSIKSEFVKFKGGSVNLIKDNETGIATITLNHPEKKNAISGQMMCQLNDIVGDLESWTVGGNGRAVLFKSNDPNYFCSGADLTSTVRNISSPEGGFKLATLMHNSVSRFARLPLISVCLVRGRAIGGGAELSLASDFRAFTPSGKLNFVQARLGVLPGWAGGAKLVSLVGRNRALEMFLTCRGIEADEAHQLGICDKLLKTESDEECLEWIRSLLDHDRHVTALMKTVCDTFGAVPYDEALEYEKRLFASVWGGKANLKALDGKLKH